MIYFTSDTHFHHFNIIKYAKRPFTSAEEMNETMIERWNEAVSPEDEVYHLGDFGFKEAEKNIEILGRLNGKIYLVKGNHDKRQLRAYRKGNVFESIEEVINLTVAGERVVLYHYPMIEWDGMFGGSWHFHGHNHQIQLMAVDLKQKRVNVGVDAWGFRPISFEEIREVASH